MCEDDELEQQLIDKGPQLPADHSGKPETFSPKEL